MARLPRLFVPGLPQLVLQRGIAKAPVFRDDADFERYIGCLRDSTRETGVQLHAYALMPDHIHLLLTAPGAGATGALMQQLGRRYVRAFNDRYQRSGTLWEGRYRSTVVDPARFLLPAYCYVELNPVRAELVTEPAHYPWSSCRHHLGLAQDVLVTDHKLFWALGNTPFERQAAYRARLEAGTTAADLAEIRYAAHSGWMLGESVHTRGEPAPNRRIAPMPKGRPKKAREQDRDRESH